MSEPVTTLKLAISFETSEGKTKSWTFNHAGSYSSNLEERIKNIAKAFVQYPCFTSELTAITKIAHQTVTKRDMTEP